MGSVMCLCGCCFICKDICCGVDKDGKEVNASKLQAAVASLVSDSSIGWV